ncbi:MAG: hypothetical protein WA790_18915 [Sulfitobacter sp.]
MRVIFALVFVASPLAAQETSVTREEGLAAWERVFAVASHPRCTNCHVGEQEAPMWEGLGYHAGKVHGMNVLADESRIGAETIPCRTCHVTSAAENIVPHAPPHIDEAWRLPPVELDWLDKSGTEICAQMRNPETNDDNTIAELVEHIETSAFVGWGFVPGGGRSVPPGTTDDLAHDVSIWGAAGTPCEND